MKRTVRTKCLAWFTLEHCRRFGSCLVLVGAGMLVGAMLSRPDSARAEPQADVPPQHFQSGSQLSVPLLKEIAGTLKQMDTRLARIETIAQQMRGPKPSPGRAN